MTPIEGLTNRRQLPRVGKIRLGIKKQAKSGRDYPVATDYFVCPPEVQKIYGEKPKALDVIIPIEDPEVWASQYYRQYSRTRGLICKGDGATCRRMIDTKTGRFLFGDFYYRNMAIWAIPIAYAKKNKKTANVLRSLRGF